MEKPPVHIVTKKHPGRVAQGYKLAALMKSRKQELRAEKSPVLQSEQSPELPAEKSPVLQKSSLVRGFWYCGIIFLAAAGGTYFWIYTRKTPAVRQASAESSASRKKILKYMD